MKSDIRWKLTSTAALAAASGIVRFAMARAFKALTGKPEPGSPERHTNATLPAVLWASAVAGAATLARLVANHGAAVAWERITGSAVPK